MFDDPQILVYEDRRCDYGEVREIAIGRLPHGLVVVIVHTDRGGVCRIISARTATRKERELYAQS